MIARLLLFSILFLPISSFAQPLELDWGQSAGGRGFDFVTSTAVDDSDNLYLTGYFRDTAIFQDLSGNDDTLISSGSADILLAKYDSTGNYQWAIGLGSSNRDQSNSVIVDENGNPVITGSFQNTVDFDPSSGSNNDLSASSSNDIFLAKYNPSGGHVWAERFGGSAESGFSLALDRNGDIFMTGYISGNTDFDPGGGSTVLSTEGQVDAFLAKYDDQGNLLRADRMGGKELVYGLDLSTDGNGHVYMTGAFEGKAGFDLPGGDSLTSEDTLDVFIAKYDLSNAYEWSYRMGGTGADIPGSIASNSNGNVAVTGNFEDDFDFYPPDSSTNDLNSKGGEDLFLAKLRSKGSLMMISQIGGPSDDQGSDVIFDADNNMHLSGNFTDSAKAVYDGEKLKGTSESNTFIAKYGPYGVLGRTTTLGQSKSASSSGVALNLGISGKLYLSGYFSDSIDLDPGIKNNIDLHVERDPNNRSDLFIGRYDPPTCTTNLTVSTTPTSCAGAEDGSATANFTGATTPYSFAWSSGDSTATADSLSRGYYLTVASDSVGCMDTAIFKIESPDALSVSMSGQDATCDGVSDGEASASVSGGTTPYSYQWSNGDTTSTIDSLPEGTYSVTVTDSNGCQASASYTVGTSSSISLSTSVTDADCGVNNGSASVTSVSGGTSPYSYTWSSGDTTATADSLYPGTYTVQVQDDIGCEAYASVNVNIDSGLAATIDDVTHVNCPGDSTGAIDISVNGGTSPYSYQWSNGAKTQDLSGIPAGFYEVEVLDADSCKAIINAEVKEPSPLQLNTSTLDASCGSSDGEATVNVSGGTTPYTYQWSSGGTAANETGLGAGSYTVTVTDSNGCSDSAVVSISEAGGPTVTVDNVSSTSCGASDGAVFVTVSGGSTPYDFTWSNGDTTEDLTNVNPGSYSLTVEDSSGCKAVIDTSIEASVPQVPICVVTVDSNSEHNQVVWEELSDPSIEAYNIYKESFSAGNYNKIGTVQDSALTTFVDTNSDPLIQSYRYKVASVDSCGNESPLSPKHKTIHLTANEGVNDNINLIWDDYVGFSYPTFYIHRYTDSTGWEKIDSIASTSNSYTDANAPSDKRLQYVVSIDLPSGGCTATRAKDYNNTISNVGTISKGGGGDSGDDDDNNTSLSQEKKGQESTRLYPNPTQGRFTLEWSDLDPKAVSIFNIHGQRIQRSTSFKNKQGPEGSMKIDLSGQETGVYWIRIEGHDKNVKRPVVVK